MFFTIGESGHNPAPSLLAARLTGRRVRQAAPRQRQVEGDFLGNTSRRSGWVSFRGTGNDLGGNGMDLECPPGACTDALRQGPAAVNVVSPSLGCKMRG